MPLIVSLPLSPHPSGGLSPSGSLSFSYSAFLPPPALLILLVCTVTPYYFLSFDGLQTPESFCLFVREPTCESQGRASSPSLCIHIISLFFSRKAAILLLSVFNSNLSFHLHGSFPPMLAVALSAVFYKVVQVKLTNRLCSKVFSPFQCCRLDALIVLLICASFTMYSS